MRELVSMSFRDALQDEGGDWTENVEAFEGEAVALSEEADGTHRAAREAHREGARCNETGMHLRRQV
jgi:hypothetical protein